jgi:hypothetical protein
MLLCDLLELLSSSESERDMLSEVRQTREEEEGEEEESEMRQTREEEEGEEEEGESSGKGR